MCAGVCLTAAVLVPNVEFVLGLTGATAAALIMGVLPASAFLLAALPAQTQARSDLAISQGAACCTTAVSATAHKHWQACYT